jgi:type I restriction enzyme S subunit
MTKNNWKKTKIGEFLFERKGLIDPSSREIFSLKKIEKIDFSEGKIFLCDYSPTKTKQIIVRSGDFVFSGLNIEKGAVAINDFDQDLVVSANYSTCQVDYSKIDREFLKFFTKSPFFKKLLTDNLKKDYGFTRPKHLVNLEIFLPSIEEQKRITEKLKHNEENRKLLQQEIDNHKNYIKNLKKQILQDAIEGKLTKEWREKNPNVEPASELLKKIKKEKEKLIAEKKIKKEKPLLPINESEIPFELPKSWVWTRLGNITNFISGNNFDSSHFGKGLGVKCIKITNAGVGELIETDDVLPQEFLEKHDSFLIYEGDLILALTRPYILEGLKISLCSKAYDKSLLNQRVAAIRSLCRNYVETKYIYSFLRTNFVLMIYKSMFEGKGQQPNLKKGDVTDLLFPLPPIAEQLAIVSRLQNLMQKLDEAEKQIEKSLATNKLLTKAILTEAFQIKVE